jgi:hypothetical protein
MSELITATVDDATLRRVSLLCGAFIIGCCVFWCCVQPMIVSLRRLVSPPRDPELL